MVCHQSRKYLQISNDKAGFKQLLQWFKGQSIDVSKTILVMEHTGLYSFCFEKFLQEKGIPFTKVNALAIKHSMGLVRGKSDKTDAQRIACYGFEKQNILQLQTPANEATQRLAMLLSTRERLVKQKAGLLNSLEEYGEF